jgi:two-component system, response regulator / RNA-binding antiterminator
VMATRDERRPIVMFTNDNDTSHVKDAVAAGVSAYIVAGLSIERIRPILDVAMARFQHEQGLRDELASTKTELHAQSIELQEQNNALEAQSNELQARGAELREQTLELLERKAELQNRKIIERAKGILMQRQNLSEQQAYDKLRKTAMGKSWKLVDVAQRMLDVEDLMG